MNNRKDMQVLTTIRKDILNKIIINNVIDLATHSYYSVFDIKELLSLPRKVLRKTRIINLYDNEVG